MRLRGGILSVLQTPFDDSLAVDWAGLERLVEDAIAGGADGFLAPVVASEVAYLEDAERADLVRRVARWVRGRVPFVAGCSSPDAAACRRHAALAAEAGADACLVAVPEALYREPGAVVPFFRDVARDLPLPLVVQDFQLGGPGLDVAQIVVLRDALPALAGVKIETAPAGPKYTAVKEACGEGFFVSGGWAVPQMIEALDRGVDAMIPESSMVRVYAAVLRAHRAGDRPRAVRLFRELLPVLAFSNQDVATSIAFFKRLLVRKGIFRSAGMRWPLPAWDAASERTAAELIDHYLAVEATR